MNLGMLRYVPRDLVSTLIGVSPSEEQELFRRVLPRDAEHGVPLYSVAECRERLEEIRREPVATVLLATEAMAARFDEHFARQDGHFATRLEASAQRIEKAVPTDEELRETRSRIDGLWQATVLNRPGAAHGLTPDQVGKKAGWSGPLVRRYANQGWFPKSLHPRGKNKPMVFDPIKVLEDISDIKKRRGKL